jgi:hypothetical protein
MTGPAVVLTLDREGAIRLLAAARRGTRCEADAEVLAEVAAQLERRERDK